MLESDRFARGRQVSLFWIALLRIMLGLLFLTTWFNCRCGDSRERHLESGYN